MANQKITALTTLASATTEDVLAIVDDPAGSPVTKKITYTALIGSFAVVGQLPFPATQLASANANTLDDYEEGAWTPAISFATPGNLSVAYSLQSGAYRKIGSLVVVTATVITSSFTHTTASSFLLLTGLPFNPAATFIGAGALSMSGYTKANFTQLFLETGASLFYVLASGSGQVGTELTATDVPTGGSIRIFLAGYYVV